MRHAPKLIALFTVAAVTLTGTAGMANAATPSVASVSTVTPTWGTYQSVAPARVLDTRSGTGAPKAPVGQGGIISVSMLGAGGLPASGVSAVVVNLTVTAATKPSFLTAWPSLTDRPTTVSSINFVAGTNRANLVTVPLGTDGKISIYNNMGTVHVIADVMGYYLADGATTSGGLYQQVMPERWLDSREPDFGGPLAPGEDVSVPVSYDDPGTVVDENSHIRALAVNITAVSPTKPGYFSSWDGGSTLPSTSTLNFAPGTVTPNMAIVPVGPCQVCGPATGFPSITVVNGSLGTTHILVDVVGFFDDGGLGDGLRFKPLTPTRIVDSRTGQGDVTTFSAGQIQSVNAPVSVAGADTYALVTNTTAVLPTMPTHLSLWAGGDPKPTVSNLNAVKGQIVANATITDVDAGNAFNVYNAQGSINVLVDVVGTMEWIAPPATARSVASVPRTWTSSAVPSAVR